MTFTLSFSLRNKCTPRTRGVGNKRDNDMLGEWGVVQEITNITDVFATLTAVMSLHLSILVGAKLEFMSFWGVKSLKILQNPSHLFKAKFINYNYINTLLQILHIYGFLLCTLW